MPKTRGQQAAENEGSSPRKSAKSSSKADDEETLRNRDIVVELLNDASIATDSTERLDCLRKVQERIIFKDPHLLDDWLDDVVRFFTDKSQEIRKWVVGFIEESCKKNPDLLRRVIANLQFLINDEAIAVRKRVIQAMTFLYKLGLKWLCQAKSITGEMEAVWSSMTQLKDLILSLIHSDNDGIRTHAIKFMEMLVVCQSHGDSAVQQKDFSLDDIPMTLKLLRRRKLEDEAQSVFDELIKYHGSPHISSANLMTCMSSLTSIAKLRPALFFAKVITALEMLHANLPPTLAKSQVSSVRKHLKNQLLSLLKSGLDQHTEKFFNNMTTLLTDLGASREEVMKAVPDYDNLMRKSKAKKKALESNAAAEASQQPKSKRAKIDIPDVEDESSEDDDEDDSKTLQESAVDITEKFIKDRLDPALVTELVMRSLPRLPHEIPAHFSNSYTPIDAAGTEGQIKHVSRLLSAQMTAAGIGPGVKQVREKNSKIPLPKIDSDDEEMTEKPTSDKGHISVIGSGNDSMPIEAMKKTTKDKVLLLPAGMSKRPSTRTKSLKLSEITSSLSPEEKSNLMLKAAQRIMNCEKAAFNGGIQDIRSKIISTLGARFSIMSKSALVAYIFGDFNKRIDLAFAWLYEEYCFYQGFHKNSTVLCRRMDDSEYSNIFCTLIKGIIERTDGKEREHLLRRMYLESPIITEEAIEMLKGFVTIAGSAIIVVNLMKDMVMRRPTKKLNCLNFLLEFCSHNQSEVRQTAIHTVLQLHSEKDFKNIIEEYAIMYLKFLLKPTPPELLFSEDRGRSQVISVWMEDTVKVCLYLFLSLLPKNQNLLKELANVYTNAKTMVYAVGEQGKPQSIKHTILRELHDPISKVPMDSQGLMDLLDNPQEGSETLITQIVHILTDKACPNPTLVAKVKELYESRFEDVRFLIPVLNGLSKNEIVQILPKLIQLNSAVIKEVFTRLVNTKGGPMTAVDLMIALHNLDPKTANTKTVVQALNLCFKEKAIYNYEVLTIVLQKLLEQPNIPLLYMRTVIQSLAMYPKMIGNITNINNGILLNLIRKQVWKQKVIWDGFIKCCEKTMPQSYAIMLQLPPTQLAQFLEEAPQIREPLLVHVQNFNSAQRAHVSARTMKVLYNDYITPAEKKGEAEETPAASTEENTNE